MTDTPEPAPDLQDLINRAASHKMTPEEIRAQKVSFVYGQLQDAAPEVTKEQIAAELDRMEGRGEPAPDLTQWASENKKPLRSDFEAAFKHAREMGLLEFRFRNAVYHTRLWEEDKEAWVKGVEDRRRALLPSEAKP